MNAKTWHVDIELAEKGRDTRARAVLVTDTGDVVDGTGLARRNPLDEPVAEIGDELAAGRALVNLSTRLRDRADADIAAAENGSYH